MATMLVKFTSFCECGTPLEEAYQAPGMLNRATFKRCRCCSQVKRLDAKLEELAGQRNRRGVMVFERST